MRDHSEIRPRTPAVARESLPKLRLCSDALPLAELERFARGSVPLCDAETRKRRKFEYGHLLTDRSVCKFRLRSGKRGGSLSESLSGQRDLRASSSRDKILEAAESLFAASGYGGVGMRQIAKAVGLSKSSLFHHFSSKLVLYGEVLDRVIERLEGGLCGDDRDPGKAAEQLVHWIDALIGTLAEDAPTARLMLRALVDEEPFPPEGPEGRELMSFERRLGGGDRSPSHVARTGHRRWRVSPGLDWRHHSNDDWRHRLPFASGDLGRAPIDEPIFSGTAAERRRREVSEFIRRGLLA